MMPSIALLFIHWVGDYLFQSNEMAAKKFQSYRWLTFHVLVYSVVLLAGVLLLIPFNVVPIDRIPAFVGLNAALHWATDFMTSRLANRVADTPSLFYPIVGFDQFLHSVALLSTLNWLG
jgi:hypothetical protein